MLLQTYFILEKVNYKILQEKVLDETDDFYDFRLRVLELVRDVTPIVGPTRCYVTMYSRIKSGASWDQTEAVLFVMSAVGKYIDV